MTRGRPIRTDLTHYNTDNYKTTNQEQNIKMGKAPVLDIQQEGEDNERSIGKKEMLYASRSTLENAQDGNILAAEYYLKLVTATFKRQFGCMTDGIVTAHDIVMLVEKLRDTFEAVELGSINEEDYFFELVTPNFYYTSGSYHPHEHVQTTLLVLCSTFESEFGDISLQGNNVSRLLTLIESYNLVVPTIPDFNQTPPPPQNGVRESNKKTNIRHDTTLTKMTKRTPQGKDFKNIRIGFKRTAPRQTKQVRRKILYVFRNRSVGGNLSYILMIQLSVVFCVQVLLVGALPVNTNEDSPLTLSVGSDGVIAFACRKEHQSASKYYTVQFEGKDRPFYADGTIDPEGLMSPDQADRFRVQYFEEGSAMSIVINIASVSVEDQGTYIVLIIMQGETPKYSLMKRVVLIFIPPGPAVCFLMPSEIMITTYMVHCHSKPGNGNSTLTCFQSGNKIPYIQDTGNTQIVYRRRFWLRNTDIPVSCCSHDIKEKDTITQTSCDQYRYPRIEPANNPISPGNKVPTKMVHVPTTKPLSVEEEKKKPSPDTTSYSGCGRNVDWPAVMLPLMAFFTYMCISNP